MDQKQKNNEDVVTIDILHILRALWHKAWLIVLIGVLMAGVGFAYASFFITPMYSSSVLLYVNNSSINLGNTSFNISASDISASQSLVKTYTEFLKNRTTLERVIEKAQVDYTPAQLNQMISAGQCNETEIMQVVVTSPDPYEASNIANSIAEVLPVRIAEIMDGASMEVVNSAIPSNQKVSPNITKYALTGMLLGILMVSAVIVVIAIMDDTIHDEEYILQHYEYPILAKIPNLLDDSTKGSGYYRQKQSSTVAK